MNQDHSKEFYQKQIKSILKTATGRDGWIEWAQLKFVKKAMMPLVENATQYFANQKYDVAFNISAALAEEMTAALQDADDSNGDIGYFVASSIELLRDITHEKIDDNLKQEIFMYCIATFKKGLFAGWDWHFDLISIAVDLVDNEKDANIIIDCLEVVSSKYETEMAQLFKLNLFKRFKNKNEVDAYINAHISNSSIRKNEIESAFQNKDFERVIHLAKDGIKNDETNKPGLVKDWYNWLLNVAEEQADVQKIIEYARFLFVDNCNPQKDYYQILKQTVEQDKWNAFLEEIVAEITPKNRWNYNDLARKTFITEQWWDRLFLMLKQNCSLDNIQLNEVYLAND